MADLREPPKGEGGALRTFVLIALLGGAALAGGLYFGGMGDVGASASRPEVEDVAAATPSVPPPDATYEDLEEAPSVPLSSTVEEPERPIRIASRPEREPPATTRREEPRTTPRTQTPPQPQQAVTQTAASTPTTGGPISLSPGTTQQTTTPSTSTVATPPPPSLTTPASTTRTDPSELRGPAGSVIWTQRPSQRRISELYPQRALRQGVGGRVQLDCSVTPSLTLNCRIATETPAGEGFGRAALSAAGSYRARATLSDGSSAVGSTTRLAVNFQAPQE